MSIIIKNRDQYTKIVLDKVTEKLTRMQLEVVDGIKVALSSLISIEYLYEIRDYIDNLLLNWKDEEIELEDDDIDE